MAKKDFKAIMGNPAERFFTAAPAPAQPSEDPNANANVKQPGKRAKAKEDPQPTHNAKSQRAQFLFTPELYADIKKIAYMERISINAIVNGLLEEYRQQNTAAINQYNKIFDTKGE